MCIREMKNMLENGRRGLQTREKLAKTFLKVLCTFSRRHCGREVMCSRKYRCDFGSYYILKKIVVTFC
jgi:hypothetical protein